MLDERKLKVLYAIINSHLLSAEPIGSRTISKEYNLGVSPATIRNEMSDLEDKGYLSKPHSSAGRVPSDKAYRLYVDDILKISSSGIERDDEIKETLYRESKQVEELIRNSAKILSALTSYTALALSPQLSSSKLKHIQIISLMEKRILIVVVNSSGFVKNSIFRLNQNISEEELLIVSNFLNEKFNGLTVEEIIKKIELENIKEMPNMEEILNAILPIINSSLRNVVNADIYSDGVTKILDYPEYSDLEKAKSFISFIENEELLMDIMVGNKNQKDDLKIVIGEENIYEVLKDCSVITANYKLGEKTIGKIGIVGPTRMDYPYLIGILKSFSKDISEVLYKMIE